MSIEIKGNIEMYHRAKSIIQEMESTIPQIVKTDQEITQKEWNHFVDNYHDLCNKLDEWFLEMYAVQYYSNEKITNNNE